MSTAKPPRASHSPRANPHPHWIAIAGLVLLVLGVLFLMGVVVAAIGGYTVPCDSRGLVVFLLALIVGGAAGFLSGSAKVGGKLEVLSGSALQIGASGAIAAVVIVLVLGFQLYATDSACPQPPSETQPSVERAKAIATSFWELSFAEKWADAHALFPESLRGVSPLEEYIPANRQFFSQFSGPPVSRDFEAPQELSDELWITSLARFDAASTFREILLFKRNGSQWVPWTFVSNPSEWPVASTFTYLVLPPREILSSVSSAPASERAALVTSQLRGRYVPASGWLIKIETIGPPVAERTCDVSGIEVQSGTPVTLRRVLDGCSQTLGRRVVVVGRLVDVTQAIEIEAVRLTVADI